MSLIVHTARVSYGGPDRFDITRKSGGPIGSLFAPSWDILRPALDAMKRADRIARGGYDGPRQAEQIRETAWALYQFGEDGDGGYRGEMRKSVAENRKAWMDVLARERIVLCCYCVERPLIPLRCHRVLLAGYFGKMGAEVRGELAA